MNKDMANPAILKKTDNFFKLRGVLIKNIKIPRKNKR